MPLLARHTMPNGASSSEDSSEVVMWGNSAEVQKSKVGTLEDDLLPNREASADGLSSINQSVSFPVKRSGLASRCLPVPGAFESVDTTLNKQVTAKRAAVVLASVDGQTNADSLSPKRKRDECELKIEEGCTTTASLKVEEKRSESNSLSNDALNNDSDHSHTNQDRDDNSSLVKNHQQTADEITSEPKSKSTIISETVKPSASSSLVSYNSSGDELAISDPVNRKDKHQRKHRRKGSSHLVKSKKSASESTTHLGEHLKYSPSDRPVNTKDIKVIKCASKSTWDSSDSDFDSTIPSGNEKVANTVVQLSSKSPFRDDRVTSRKSKKQKAQTEKCGPHEGRTFSPGTKTTKTSDKVKSASRSCHDSHRSRERNRKDSSDNHNLKPQYYKRRSNSSARSPEASLRSKSSDKRRYHRSRSPSRKSHSSRWSTTDSRDSSYRSRRHRRHQRRRSNSYSSRSSFRHSSTSTRSHYRGRSDSSSSHSGGRRRYRSRSSRDHRRRYRRHSYSSRSATRSRSRHSSDSSSRYSSKSSHSSISSRGSSHNSVRRCTTSGYLCRSRDGTSQRRQKSTVTSVTLQENHPVCTAIESYGQSTSKSESNGEALPGSCRFTSSSVADTVSAAVRRVTGARTPANKTSLKASSISSETGQLNPSNGQKQPGSLGENNVVCSTSVVVDIPLPKDEDPPYIGPQLSPDLAERFGLPLARTGSADTSDAGKPLGCIQPREVTVTSSYHNAAENTGADQSFGRLSQVGENRRNALEFTIPPEKAEQYRVLQEQAKQHALRRHNLLTGVNTDSELAQKQQLALLQQQLHSSALLHAENLVPTVSLVPLSSMGFPYGVPTLVPSGSASTVEQWSSQIASAIQARQFVSTPNLLSANQQVIPSVIDAQTQQQLLNSATYINGVSPLMTSRPHQIDPNITAALQQLQMATAAQSGAIHPQLVQANVGAQGMFSAPSTAAVTSKLLQHLAMLNHQKASTSQTGQPTSNALSQYQQLQFLAQLQKQIADSSRMPSFVASPSEATVLHGVEQAQLASVPGISGPLSTLLQQQQILAALQQPRQACAAAQPPAGNAMAAFVSASGTHPKPASQQHPSNTEAVVNPVAASMVNRLFPQNTGNVAFAAASLAQQQQLQAVQVIAAAQQKQQRVTSTTQDQALLVALATSAAQRRQQQQLLQTQLLQQQQQQALAASALLAAQLQQRQHPPQQ